MVFSCRLIARQSSLLGHWKESIRIAQPFIARYPDAVPLSVPSPPYLAKTAQRAIFSSDAKVNNNKGSPRMKLLAIGIGTLVGFGYWYRKSKTAGPTTNVNRFLTEKPPVNLVAKRVVNENDASKLKLVLYQYEPCPFCKKVRAFLDFSGLSYDIVEVNPVTKKQLDWSPYKKVPIILVKVGDGYQQLNDSTLIISSLASLLTSAGSQDIRDVVQFYPEVQYDNDSEKRSDILNRYFIMFGEKEPVGRTNESIDDERRWRQWSDDVLMHTLSPNIYRTWDEALEAFNMFSKNGDWERIFSTFERYVVIYVGAAVMYLIGKRLKKRHKLEDDVRQSLYQEIDHFLKAVEARGTTFLGGEEPNLADLAIYGCVSSIEGTRSFHDAIKNTRLAPWYDAMRIIIGNRRGKIVSS